MNGYPQLSRHGMAAGSTVRTLEGALGELNAQLKRMRPDDPHRPELVRLARGLQDEIDARRK